MNFAQVIADGSALLERAGVKIGRIEEANFLDWAERVRDSVLALPPETRDHPAVTQLALGLRHLRDEFDTLVAADPMILYRPQHAVAMAFHRSTAKTRFLRFANRSSKTTAANAEVYYHLTGYHPYRPIPMFPTQAAVVGLNYSQYAPQVFEAKWLEGEAGNALSPIFPENGKWFHRYDQVRRILELGCKDCAEQGQSKSCSHTHPRMILFSDENGAEPMSGSQYGIVHLDEEVSEDFDSESAERVKTVPNSCRVVSLTPLAGEAFWTEQKLTRSALAHETYPDGRPVVELFTIDQFSAGLVDHDEIRAGMKSLNAAEIDARIFGIPATNSAFAVFDLPVLREMQKDLKPGQPGVAVINRKRTFENWGQELPRSSADADILGQAGEKVVIDFRLQQDGLVKIWEPPRALGQYIIGGDVAEGLTGRDLSTAVVLRMFPVGLDIHFKMVAKLAGWMDPILYAEEVFKLGLFYHPCYVNMEQNGPGLTAIKHMKDLGCWFLFRDQNSPAAFQDDFTSLFGTSTNTRSKSVIISLLQSVFKLNKLGKQAMEIPDTDTLAELRAYVQKPTDTGKSLKFGADGNAHDDHVMALALAVYAAKTSPLYDFDLEKRTREGLAEKGDTRSFETKKLWEDLRRERQERVDHDRELEREFAAGEEGDGWTR